MIAESRALGTLLRRPPRYGVNAAAVPLAPGVPTYIRITDIDDYGRFAPDPKVGVEHPKSSDYRMSAGELVLARTGASVGKSYLYDPRDGEVVYAGFLINIAPDPKLLNPKYLSLFVQSKDYWDWIARTSVRSGQPGVNGREYAQLPVPLPDIAVQNAIADAMTDVDELIADLERVIAKKQAIKQGMMQELLTGKTRLSGFSRAWEKKRLGDLGHWRGGLTPPMANPRYWLQGDIPWLTSSDVRQGWIDASRERITADAVTETGVPVVAAGSVVVVARSGILRRFLPVGITSEAVAINQDLRVLEPGPLHHPQFLAYVLVAFERHILRDCIKAGTTVESIDSTWFAGVEIAMPNLDEQTAIAAVLSDTDAEILALQRRWDKARAIKRGMMQELLTGRTRLPVDGSVA